MEASEPRITPEQCLSDFVELGLQPIAGSFLRFGKVGTGISGACGLGARHLAECSNWLADTAAWADEKYGREYAGGFVVGFDHAVKGHEGWTSHPSPRTEQGLIDGYRCGRAVLEKAPVENVPTQETCHV